MKKLKFRVWDKLKSRFLPSHKNEGLRFNPNIHSKEEDFVSFQLDFFIENENNRYEVQQFTGLKDSKGVDVYEGDIIVGKFDLGLAGWVDHKWIVQWHNELGYQWNYWNLDTIEVVGNIFD